MLVIRDLLPRWLELAIHESSPEQRGASLELAKAPGYVASQFYPRLPLGSLSGNVRCENLEMQTFPSESFDLVVTQDVMEHVFDPAAAYREIHRTLKSSGYHVHTTPIYKELVCTEQKAKLEADGTICYFGEPEYHGNPISGDGSLVTYHYGYDLADLITTWAPFDVEIRRYADRTRGIIAEFSEVIICRKRSQ